MMRRWFLVVLVMATACQSAEAEVSLDTVPRSAAPSSGSTTTTITTTTTTSPPTTSSTTTTTTSTSTTTTSTLPPEVFDPSCVLQVGAGESVQSLVAEFDDVSTDYLTVMAENGMETLDVEVGQLLDMCVDNGLDDINGTTRPERNAVVAGREVTAQQEQLNMLFANLGTPELLVDGISGPITRQRLCAFRLANGLEVSTADMEAGSDEEALLMAQTELPIPQTTAIESGRWILIDQACQIMFVGQGNDRLQFVFPTSTGQAKYPTRSQDRSPAFKYNPASHNNGWHNSYDYPASDDNPLNGNMYRPLYFDRGQAIHGANNVPTKPASHGCARLRTAHMDQLVDWLGLGGLTSTTQDASLINVTVNVQGHY